ncbi:helix-turn-helix domain-containing protein [Hydrogenophaga sp. NFH-34]|uniref:helix-turn-helix domain-containing protein n=1 Tax=Hydrogenophaga sp. NFH-34 TaxID=2744446 RepID=UPI001F426448|nr:helix-turn-helix transcriptional regulator [Hydrogenophaga sp. NFH-34]
MKDIHTKRNNFAAGLRSARNARGMSQEDFGLVSSRTYVSSLERGLKSPTLNKVDDLADVLGVHPLTLLILSYTEGRGTELTPRFLEEVMSEVEAVLNSKS